MGELIGASKFSNLYQCGIGGVDYDSKPYTIIFTSNQTRAPFNISIYDDDILENDESFTLMINDSLPSRFSVEGQAMVTIMDTDCKYTDTCLSIQFMLD